MHPCPLRSIQLKNFKSIANGEVEFKPLTVLVGMNSSGKSSVLQAVRFLSQTVNADKVGTEVLLNSGQIKLGAFSDVRTAGTDGPVSLRLGVVNERSHDNPSDADLGIEALLTLDMEEPVANTGRGDGKIVTDRIEVSSAAILYCAQQWLDAFWKDFVQDVWKRVWDRKGEWDEWFWDNDEVFWDDKELLLANLEVLAELEGDFDDEWPMDVINRIRSGKERLLAAAEDDDEPPGSAERGNDPLDESFAWAGVDHIRRAFRIPDTTSLSERFSNTLKALGELPQDDSQTIELVFQLYNLGTREHLDEASRKGEAEMAGTMRRMTLERMSSEPGFHRILRSAFYRRHLADLDEEMLSRNLRNIPDLSVLDLVLDDIRHRASAHDWEDEAGSTALRMIQVGGLRFVDGDCSDHPDRVPITDTLKIARSFIPDCIADAWPKDPILTEEANHALAEDWRPGVAELLREHVDYLGPLRQEPRPYFDFDDEKRSSVGAAGEHLSQVLQSKSGVSILVPGLGHEDLLTGLRYWLQELEIAEEVTVEARGRAGVSIEVRPPGLDRSVDLTSVGVGVSQILPVLAVCLLAEPGDVVLLEQPELHLHPALQMRLADFLLACADSGRQIIVETHSEHLVNRLRRRVAEDDSDNIGELVRIVFAERDADGHTSFRASEINPLGGMSEDWPDGFLDLGARDAQRLLQAGLAKHRRRASRQPDQSSAARACEGSAEVAPGSAAHAADTDEAG